MPAVVLQKILQNYLQELPVVGFNSGRYDFNVMKPFFIHHFLHLAKKQDEGLDNEASEEAAEKPRKEEKEGEEEEEGPFKFTVKRENTFMCVSTEKLKFLDITNFIAPGFSYSKYLAAYDVHEQKGFFPYEYIHDLAQLDETALPPQNAFHSNLRNTDISDDDYAYCQRVWVSEGMTTLSDFLVWYNNKDVAPFLEALEKQTEFYQSLGLDMLKDAISVPGLTLRYLFKTMPPSVYFSLMGRKQEDVHHCMRDSIVGGPSVIFHRYHERDVTRIRGGKLCKSVVGYDANALYLWSLMQEMPTEHPTIRSKENNFRAEKTDYYGQMAREWLEWTAKETGRKLRHKFNGHEMTLGPKKVPVDGWNGSSNTAYQFHGCLWHGHNCEGMQKYGKIHPKSKKPFSELRANTKQTTAYLRCEAKVQVVEMWECEWAREKRTNAKLREFLKETFVSTKLYGPMTQTAMKRAIEKGTIFGFVECDIHVPESLKPKFSDFPPIFKNTQVSVDDIGDLMRSYAEKEKIMGQPRRMLISSFFGDKILLATPLLQWYLNHGLVVTTIHKVIEYRPQRCFLEFGETVSSARRSGDKDPSKAILADTFKLLGNSAYGKTLTNIAKHRDVKYADKQKAEKLINDKRFRSLTELGEECIEVESSKATLKWNLPLQIGLFVYQYAKLRMLQFNYDFLNTFLDKEDFQLCEMDTDSLYLALSTESLDDAVRPDLLPQFYEAFHSWFPAQACDGHQEDFTATKLQRNSWSSRGCSDCTDRAAYDKRTPGLFKVEWEGDGIVALCSKTYFCFGDHNKLSCKGLNKRLNDINKDQYLQVLQQQTSGSGINRGFKTDGKSVFTYQQTKNALSYFYPKRKVLQDGVSTEPLAL
ncbi:hypothetical protein V1264_021595 [Littorina saxatilis]